MQSLEQSPQTPMSQTKRSPFQYVIIIEPLGLLYGSAGRFLSPENLVGRSGTSFPPSAATLSGLFSAHANTIKFDEDKEEDKKQRKEYLEPLQFAGPFWTKRDNPQNFLVPTPFNCVVKMDRDNHCEDIPKIKSGQIQHKLFWYRDDRKWLNQCHDSPVGKFASNSWIHIEDWNAIAFSDGQVADWPKVYDEPWKFVPHLHPRLREDERRVVDPQESDRGSLFLENGVQLDPNACLVYLSNTPIDNGWYRFGGEGHLVDLRCEEIKEGSVLYKLLNEPLGRSFATITPAVWGSNRRSCREPMVCKDQILTPAWKAPSETPNAGKSAVSGLLTQRPSPFRYRLGDSNDTRKNAPKRLSRGRYAVPAGTVYVLEKPLSCWQEWPDEWFPEEGVSYKRWGCGLSLPMESAIPQGAAKLPPKEPASRHATSGAQPEES